VCVCVYYNKRDRLMAVVYLRSEEIICRHHTPLRFLSTYMCTHYAYSYYIQSTRRHSSSPLYGRVFFFSLLSSRVRFFFRTYKFYRHTASRSLLCVVYMFPSSITAAVVSVWACKLFDPSDDRPAEKGFPRRRRVSIRHRRRRRHTQIYTPSVAFTSEQLVVYVYKQL